VLAAVLGAGDAFHGDDDLLDGLSTIEAGVDRLLAGTPAAGLFAQMRLQRRASGTGSSKRWRKFEHRYHTAELR
jgi:hypothetical protein